jgi:IclR family transcriptional regulator, KDG regulon repressor
LPHLPYCSAARAWRLLSQRDFRNSFHTVKLLKRRATARSAISAPAARPRSESRLLVRALSVLDCFTKHEEWAFMDLCQAAGLHKSTAFRILSTLEAAGYVDKRPASGLYRVGRKWTRLDRVLLAAEPLRWAALAPLQDLAQRTEETVHVGILYGGESVTVQVVEGTHAVRMHSAVGKRAPAHASAMGKTFLAHLDDPELDDFISRFGVRSITAHTISEPLRLKRHLAIVRQRGWAVDSEELEPGLRCVAVPIVHGSGRPFAALSISGPAWRLAPDRDPSLAALLRDTARTVAAMVARVEPAAGAVERRRSPAARHATR